MPTISKSETIRSTAKYSLYRGFDQTAKLYSVIKLKQGHGDYHHWTDTWLPEMEKERLIKLSDEDFDSECSKLNYS